MNSSNTQDWFRDLEAVRAENSDLRQQLATAQEKLKLQFDRDPEMAFDDDLGWLHKNSLAEVSRMRQQLANMREQLGPVEEALVDISKHRSEDQDGPGSYPSWMAERSTQALAIVRQLRKEPL